MGERASCGCAARESLVAFLQVGRCKAPWVGLARLGLRVAWKRVTLISDMSACIG